MGSVKISDPLGPTQLKTYFEEHYTSSHEAYYSEKGEQQGYWMGPLAQRWVLEGGVNSEAFNRLIDGQDPLTGEQLVKWRPAKEQKIEPWRTDSAQWGERMTDLYRRYQQQDIQQSRLAPSFAVKGYPPKLNKPEYSERQKQLLAMHAIAADLYRANLASDAGADSRSYLAERGITPASIADFGIGFSLGDGRQLVKELQLFGPELMRDSGLLVELENGEFRDKFRDRIMFPIQDSEANTIAFGGRKLSDEAWGPKYLNSPTTEIYRKSGTLYNLHRAAGHTQQAGKIVLNEGYLDVIAAHQAGVKNVIATCGTAMSEEQADLVKRLAPVAVLNFDADAAGRKATRENGKALLQSGAMVRVLNLPDSHDPASYVKEFGAAAYQESLVSADGAVAWIFQDAGRDLPDDGFRHLDSYRATKSILQNVAPELRGQISQEFAAYLGLPEEQLIEPKTKHIEHRAGYDFTISPHKSITAAAIIGGDTRLVKLHERAVEKVMEAAKEYAQARLAQNQTANTESFLAACFLHKSARPVGGVPDPHLHTHAVVFNMTEVDGQIRAVQPLEWYRIQSYLDAVYQSEMAVGIQELGYTLERTHDIQYAAIAGYAPEYIESISRRTTEIEKRKEELGVYGAAADAIVAKATRESKVDWSVDQIRDYHRKQSWEFGIDPDAIPAAARQTPHRTIEPAGTHEAITYARHHLMDHDAVFDHYQVVEHSLRHGLGALRRVDVEHALKFCQSDFVEVDHYRKAAPGKRYTTPEMINMEKSVMQATLDGKNAVQPIAPEVTRDQFREQYRARLNNAQMRLAYSVVTCPDRVLGIQGGAGVGKTTVLDPTRQIIEDHGFEVIGIAATTNAVSELAAAGIQNSQTIQRFLVAQTQESAKPRVLFLDEASLASTEQVHGLFENLRPEDRVILCGDIRQHQSVQAGRIFEQLQQVGMATFHLNKIMRQKDSPALLEAVKSFTSGDVRTGFAQLKEQGWIEEHVSEKARYKAIARAFAQSPDDHIAISPDNNSLKGLNYAVQTTLRADGSIDEKIHEANILRVRQNLTEAQQTLAFNYQAGDVIRFAKRNKQIDVKSGDYAKVESMDRVKNTLTVRLLPTERGEEPNVVTYNPKAVKGIQVFTEERREFSVGDRIQFTQPWRAKRVDNRDFATITHLDEVGNVRATLHKDTPRQISFNLKEMPHLDLGYAVTTYAVQGSSKEHVLFNAATQDSRVRQMLDKIMANVAVSRARRTCKVFCDSEDDLVKTFEKVHLKTKAHSPEEIKGFAEQHQATRSREYIKEQIA